MWVENFKKVGENDRTCFSFLRISSTGFYFLFPEINAWLISIPLSPKKISLLILTELG
jgi:hypothetical protein